MSLKSILAAGGLAGAALLLSAVAALAAPGMATANVNVRTGPSTGYPAVDTLYDGERVDIGQCRGGWCYVSHSGPDGWVSANYLARRGGPVYREPAPPPRIIIRPPVFHPPYHRPPHHWNPPHHRPPHHGHRPPNHGHTNPPPKHPGSSADICRKHPDWSMCRPRPNDSRPHIWTKK